MTKNKNHDIIYKTNPTLSERTKNIIKSVVEEANIKDIFKEGKETSTLKRLTGNQSKEKIISKLKSNGYINE